MRKLDSGTNYTRFALGDLTLVALRDGFVDMPPSRLRQPGNRPFETGMPAQVELVDGRLRLSVNAFLVVDHGEHLLIDTGAADAWLPTMGLLLEALDEAGVARGDIGTVALTHTHQDHINGLVAADGSDAFPNLERLFVQRAELALLDKKDRLARFRHLRLPLADAYRLSPAVTSVPAIGHEVGHTAFEVESAGETLLIWGDVVHIPSIQFGRPEVAWELDADQDHARATRQSMLERAAHPDVYVAGAHLNFPGIGAVSASGEGFRFTPL